LESSGDKSGHEGEPERSVELQRSSSSSEPDNSSKLEGGDDPAAAAANSFEMAPPVLALKRAAEAAAQVSRQCAAL
jgi:hypothetical protein